MPPPAAKPSNVRWAVFSLACGTSWLLYLHRYVFALIKPELQAEWGLSKVQLGFLDSAFSLFATLFQVPLGAAADVLGVRLVLTGLILLWCLGLWMHGRAASPDQLWYARITMGIGQSAVYANLSRMAQLWFPPRIRTTLQGLAGISAGRLGGLSANLLFASLLLGVLGLDWRTAIYIFAIGGIAFAGVFFLVFRNSPREHPLANAAEADLMQGPSAATNPQQPRMTISQMLGSLRPRALANLLALNVQTVLSTIADNIYSNWIPLFLAEVHRLEYKTMGIYSALPLLGGAIAGLTGGVLNDWLIARTGNRRWSRSGIALCGKGTAAVVLLAALLAYDSPYVFCWLLFVVKLFGDWSLATSWGVVTDIGGRATASVFAFNNTIAGFALILASPMLGYVAQQFGWRTVFVLVAAMYALCALSWLLVDCTIPVIGPTKESEEASSVM
ncbi:MAG TPA: MFS transporter [Pirellulaceae bacterium]|nr:MFS transporter [Pirellulaceae bacterium]